MLAQHFGKKWIFCSFHFFRKLFAWFQLRENKLHIDNDNHFTLQVRLDKDFCNYWSYWVDLMLKLLLTIWIPATEIQLVILELKPKLNHCFASESKVWEVSNNWPYLDSTDEENSPFFSLQVWPVTTVNDGGFLGDNDNDLLSSLHMQKSGI